MADKDQILSDMLDGVSSNYDKRPGSFIFDSLAPAAEQFAATDRGIEAVQGELSIENLSGGALAQRVRERTGIERKAATRAIGSVIVTGTGTIQIGNLFETVAGTQFRATETKAVAGSGLIAIEAIKAGSSGNVAANTITLFPVTLSGFTAVNNPNPTQDGFEAESDADLLQRYYDRVRTPATSGNRAHYLAWAKEVSGVGDARIIPLWNGSNTVKVVIIDSDKTPASAAVVSAAQTYIDPGASGLGDGVAPIGAYATVVSAIGVSINVDVTITIAAGYTQAQVEASIADGMTQYLKEIAFIEPVVSYARSGAAILASEGVADYTGLTVNGSTNNVPIDTEEVAVLGTVTVHVT
ncbi:baseplate J/gp47 family protein [Paenibacillus sp. GYB004]|uniref:baseplate J/gp47 family protein n=1 Tax=Paenibacillus sp. GYB004 TaxID=2994393 RepID=UPI002F96BB88